MSSLSLLFCCFLAISTALAQCPAPTITSPTNNQNVDGTYGAARFTGTVPTPRDSSCTQIRFYRATDNFLLSVLDAGSTAATFDRTIGGLMPGQLSVYALTTGQNGLTPSTRSNTVTFNIEQGCSQPVIQTPANNAVLSTRRFSISGTTICPYINAYINNQLVGSTIASSSGVYQLSSGNALPDGDYLLRIVAYRSLAGPTTQSAESQFSVASTEPYSTAGLSRRRRLTARDVCAANEDLCFIKSSVKRSSYKCVPDLDSNLERCGSCDGPDCSALPNVDEVACVLGQCIVRTCNEGYTLRSGHCI